MDNPQATDIQIGWLAGIIDGEGSIAMGWHVGKRDRGVYNPAVSIVNSNPQIIWDAMSILELIGCTYHVSARGDRNSLGDRTIWVIQIHRMSSLVTLLRKMVPHLRGKQARAGIMLSYVMSRAPKVNSGNKWCDRAYTDQEKSWAEKIRSLNDYTRDSEFTEKIESVLQGNLAEPGRNDPAPVGE